MSKKHFIALADALKAEKSSYVSAYGEPAFSSMVLLCMQFCKTQNGNFNAWRFENYVNGLCGPNGGAVR